MFVIRLFLFISLLEDSITCLDPETKDLSNYTTDKPLGDSWTDKVLAMKDTDKDKGQDTASKGQGDGADDDEWVSFCCSFILFDTPLCKTLDFPLLLIPIIVMLF